MQLTSSGHGENPLGETFAGFGLVAETEFSPLDRRPDGLFGCIVCRLESLVSEESEKMVPVIEQSFGASAYVSIRAGQVLLAVPLHASPHESGGTQELLAGDVAFSKSMPATEDPPHFFEHIPREYVGIRTGAPILESLELALFYWLIEVAGYKRWATVSVIFGMNAITIYFLSEVLDTSLRFVLWYAAGSTMTLRSYLFRSIFAPLSSPEGASLLFALSYVFLMFLIAWAMWRMRIFIRV